MLNRQLGILKWEDFCNIEHIFVDQRFLCHKVFTDHLAISNLLGNIPVVDFGVFLTSLMFYFHQL